MTVASEILKKAVPHYLVKLEQHQYRAQERLDPMHDKASEQVKFPSSKLCLQEKIVLGVAKLVSYLCALITCILYSFKEFPALTTSQKFECSQGVTPNPQRPKSNVHFKAV